MRENYWQRHPMQYTIVEIIREGEWVTHVFEWLFMMVSRFAGYLMTLAVGYLIFYAIEFKKSLEVVAERPEFADQLAIVSNVIINVAPELVFPGVVVLCMRAFTARRWLDGTLYLITTITFVVLTMVLLNAFMNNEISKAFLASMLFWRAGAALFYTVVVAYCGGHGGLSMRLLLAELDTLRAQRDSGQQTASSLQKELGMAKLRMSSLQQQVGTGHRERSRGEGELESERQKVSSLQKELDTAEARSTTLGRELKVALVEMDTLRSQLDGKKQELTGLRETLESEQQWQGGRVERLEQQLLAEQDTVVTLRRQVHKGQLDSESLQGKLDSTHRELEAVQVALSTEREKVSTLREHLDSKEQEVSRLRVQLNSLQQVDSGKPEVDGGQHKVLHLDSRSRKSGQVDSGEIIEEIRDLLCKEPGLSGRALACRLNISPTTANRWKSRIENQNAASRSVNE
jgi:peptidoglycan hydrolase CwlO-like protein